MDYCDEELFYAAEQIEKNLDLIVNNKVDRDLVSANILALLRSFVEHLALQIYCRENAVSFIGPEGEYEFISKSALPWVKNYGVYRFVYEWHKYLQKTNSHFLTRTEEGSRLLLHYYSYLVKAKSFEKDSYNIDILPHLNQFPLDLDKSEKQYYEKIAVAINDCQGKPFALETMPYYVERKKLIYINRCFFYELVLLPANDYSDKFNRITVYSKEDVMMQFAIRADFSSVDIDLFGCSVKVQVLKNWSASIRPCELKNLAKMIRMPKR